MEAPAGFEPAITVLQTVALATWRWSHFPLLLYQNIGIMSKKTGFSQITFPK